MTTHAVAILVDTTLLYSNYGNEHVEFIYIFIYSGGRLYYYLSTTLLVSGHNSAIAITSNWNGRTLIRRLETIGS